jgi:hypothetical protein
MSISTAAFLKLWRFNYPAALLDPHPTADLASRSKGLPSTCGFQSIPLSLASLEETKFSCLLGLKPFSNSSE